MLSRRLFRWIPTPLLAVNLILVMVSLFLTAYIIWVVERPFPEQTAPRSTQSLAAALVDAPVPPAIVTSPVIAQRNLFSPTRTESPVTLASGAAALPNPSLHGVVLGDANTSVAYLQDPATKRVGGYHVGEPIAGGIVRAIDADRVVLERHGSRVEVRLRDPLRPRQAVVAASEGSDVREAAVATVEPRQSPTSQGSPLAPRPLMPPSRNYRPPFPRLVPAGGFPVMAPQESASAGTRAGR